jgi:hypothetical protein
VPASNLRTGTVWPRVLIQYSFKNILILSIYLELVVLFSRHSTCDIIPKLSINMETYPHLVSSEMPHIFIIYLNTKFVQIPRIILHILFINFTTIHKID